MLLRKIRTGSGSDQPNNQAKGSIYFGEARLRLSLGLVATAPSSDFVWRTLTLLLGNIAGGESDM